MKVARRLFARDRLRLGPQVGQREGQLQLVEADGLAVDLAAPRRLRLGEELAEVLAVTRDGPHLGRWPVDDRQRSPGDALAVGRLQVVHHHLARIELLLLGVGERRQLDREGLEAFARGDLVTAFGPFDGRIRNASSLALDGLKREFPRIPLYDDFWQWAKWGEALMNLHLNYETETPWGLVRKDIEQKQQPKAKLKADKSTGVIKNKRKYSKLSLDTKPPTKIFSNSK